MNKKGFTLMELLLVVAVLAIVAAAAAPTFFGGAKEALNEAKKSTFMSAYQNTVSGANLLVGIAASQGTAIPKGDLKFTSNDGAAKTLKDYSPVSSRRFSIIDSTTVYCFTAKMGENGKDVVISYGVAPEAADAEPTSTTDITVTNSVEAALTAAWKALNPTTFATK